MANVLVDSLSLTAIANAIRSKLGVQTTYKPSEMAGAIDSISGGGITPTGTKQISITENGTVAEDVTNYASAEIAVNVPSSGSSALYPLQNGTFTFSNGNKVTITNGSHVEIEAVGGQIGYVDLSDITENTTTFTNVSNVQNHSAKFTINNGEVGLFLIKNYSAPHHGSFNAYGTGTSNIGMGMGSVTSFGYATKEFAANTACGCLFFAGGETAGTYSFDVMFLVNGNAYV